MHKFTIETVTIDINKHIHDTIKGTIDNELRYIVNNCFHAQCNCPSLVSSVALEQARANMKHLIDSSTTTFTHDTYTVRHIVLDDDYDNDGCGRNILFDMFNAEYDWFTNATNWLHANIHNTLLRDIGTSDFVSSFDVDVHNYVSNIERRYNVIKRMFVINKVSDVELTEWCEDLNYLL